MKILSIDCSATPASVAIVDDGKIVSTSFTNVGLTHSQTLLPMVESTLKQAQIALDDIDCFSISVGPGSFTGVRIGVAALKGLTAMTDDNCLPISTLEAMAYNYAGVRDCVVCSTMDARCNQVYTALFSVEAGNVKRLTDDQAILISDMPDFINNEVNLSKNDVIFVGDGAAICYNALKDVLKNISLSPVHLMYQSAVGVAQATVNHLNLGQKPISSELVLPVYLRAPQAERELKKKMMNS